MRTYLLPAYVTLMTFSAAACRTVPSDSDTKSGPGGSPQQWTCNELRSEYTRLRPELTAATQTFLASKEKLGANGNGAYPVSTPTMTTAPSPSPTIAPNDLINVIAQGDDAVPALPEPLNSFKQIYENSAGIPGRTVVGCDDAYGKYATDKSNQILEQCRYLVKLSNLLTVIAAEYNQGRDGECRAGKADLQKDQASTLFPYCVNACRFGLTTCSRCEFSVGRLTSSYICGDEQDAKQAVAAHCKANTCSNTEPSCTTDVFNDIAVGTTALKDTTTRATIRQNVGAKFNVEVSAGATLKVNAGTHLDTNIETRVMLRNSRGAPVLTSNGGDTATVYTCAVTVNAATITDLGIEVGGGFDLIVAKGGQTITTGGALEAATSYNTQSREISAAGVSMGDMLEGCKAFAISWGKNDLPALLTHNIVFKTIASKFLGKTKDMYSQDISSSNTYCLTDRRTINLFNKAVQYMITNVWWDLQENSIGFKYHYDAVWRGYDSPVYTFTVKDLGTDRYNTLRQEVFSGSVTTAHVRELIESSYFKGGFVRNCQTGRFK